MPFCQIVPSPSNDLILTRILTYQTPQPIMPFCTWRTSMRAAVLRRSRQALPIQESSPSQHDHDISLDCTQSLYRLDTDNDFNFSNSTTDYALLHMEHWRARSSAQTARAGSADPGEQPYDQPGRPDLLLSFRILLGGINRELESSAATAACLDFGGPNHCT